MWEACADSERCSCYPAHTQPAPTGVQHSARCGHMVTSLHFACRHGLASLAAPHNPQTTIHHVQLLSDPQLWQLLWYTVSLCINSMKQCHKGLPSQVSATHVKGLVSLLCVATGLHDGVVADNVWHQLATTLPHHLQELQSLTGATSTQANTRAYILGVVWSDSGPTNLQDMRIASGRHPMESTDKQLCCIYGDSRQTAKAAAEMIISAPSREYARLALLLCLTCLHLGGVALAYAASRALQHTRLGELFLLLRLRVRPRRIIPPLPALAGEALPVEPPGPTPREPAGLKPW